MVPLIKNFIDNEFVASHTGRELPVLTPFDQTEVAKLTISDEEDLNRAVACAKAALPAWQAMTCKMRAQICMKMHSIIDSRLAEIAEVLRVENGKASAEAMGSVAKGNEVLEFANAIPQMMTGEYMRVARDVTVTTRIDPLGVCCSIMPFNFPFMVPMWTLGNCIVSGNAFIMKPSRDVPMCADVICQIAKEAGVPAGIIQSINGGRDITTKMCEHPDVKAVTFVGSSPVCELVRDICHKTGKRCLAMGSAKNHMIVLPDADLAMTTNDVVNSYSGSTGQRCMAAAVLNLCGTDKAHEEVMKMIVKTSEERTPGSGDRQIGPVIRKRAYEHIVNNIQKAIDEGAKLILDGRDWPKRFPDVCGKGYWIGPTILEVEKDSFLVDLELFGPVLTVVRTKTHEEAIELQNASRYGNASCVYTSCGQFAEYFATRMQAGMIGVNIGVPVPREPFAFGGIKDSKYGDFDITGASGVRFFTEEIKVTTKWVMPRKQDMTWMD